LPKAAFVVLAPRSHAILKKVLCGGNGAMLEVRRA